ncbi:MAG: recombination mediator RecR [Bacteroidales bacterium]|jgi:recombination protein RecR|nr:recombination mediator RecR [Bacteroidales bacterium]HHT53067.1 recombination protein RecR [Bacteroidales bacterium]
MLIQYSKILENCVNEVAKLPGIGKRSALRIVLDLVKKDAGELTLLTDAIQKLHEELKICSVCYNLSDEAICSICADPKRDQTTICVVQDIRDVIAIENTQQYRGVYHVLGGVISPMDGIGPQQIRVQELVNRVSESKPVEVLLALPATPEGDTTNYYIYKSIKDWVSKITTLARGVGINEELEYTDPVTLSRSLLTRTDIEQTFIK